MSPEKMVSRVFVAAEGQVLLLRRAPDDDYKPGGYDLPGGGLEPNESPLEAAVRETAEEVGLGIRPHLFQEVTGFKVPYDDTLLKAERHVFIVQIDASQKEAVALSDEHDQSCWVTPARALKLFNHPFYSAALRYVLKEGLL